MKKLSKNLAMYICMFVTVFCAMALKAEAANTTTGTLGERDSIVWTYDEDAKALTLTGDGKLETVDWWDTEELTDICPDVESIMVKNCKLSDCGYMFANLGKVQSITFENFDTSQATSMSDMFLECESLSSLDVSGFDTSQVTDMSGMFDCCFSLSELKINSFDTSKVTDMEYMFYSCESLRSLDVSNFNTAKVTDMSGMFCGCESLSSLNVSNFNTAKVTDMSGMFCGCESLSSLNVSDFDTSQVTDMTAMFDSCKSLSSLDLSNFDTSQVNVMTAMFYGCENLSSLEVSSFDTSNVTYMIAMFSDCKSLSSLNLSNFDTAKVSLMAAMFAGCESLRSLDVSNFNISQGTELSSVFAACNALEVIYAFKDMNEGAEAELPGTFADLNQKQTTTLTKEFCNTTLINVNNLVTGVSVSPASAELKPGDTKQLHATVTPTKAAIKDVTWKSSNTAVATVDATGKVTAVAEGTATITATAKDGTGKKATCEVIVVDPVKAFVERMYTVALGRASDPAGINYWTEELLSHRKDGAAISVGFIMSEEFVSKNYSNEEYLKVLYRTFFDREPDTGGMNFWLEQMKAGRSRKSVLAGFVNSKEFTEICESFGINRGTMEDDATATGAGQFVERLYSIALERTSDPAGLKDWADRINNRTNTPEQVAKEFFLSPEYMGKNTSNDKYVETLYLVFMDRASEASGKAYWVGQLNQGMSRESVLEGFAQSEEFKEIMERYGL